MVKWKSKRKGRKVKIIIEKERKREGREESTKKAVVQSNNRLADVHL